MKLTNYISMIAKGDPTKKIKGEAGKVQTSVGNIREVLKVANKISGGALYKMVRSLPILLIMLLFACKKESITIQPMQTIFHYSNEDVNTRSCDPATGLSLIVNDGYLNFIWNHTTGKGVLFTINGIATNGQWFSGSSWTGISIPLTDPVAQQLCGTSFDWHITTYCDPWYVGTDSSTTTKQYATATVTGLSCPVFHVQSHGHGHH